MAVQNQTGRFPKKWDKTGVVVENMDHDKVLVRMDGSRRLTTRNRRFVKKIVSTADLPDQDVPLNHVQENSSGPVGGAVEDTVPESVDGADTPENTNSLDGMQQETGWSQSGTGSEMVDSGAHDTDSGQYNNMQPLSPVPSASELPAVRRPQRDKRPNVRYNTDEYDLSGVSVTRRGLLLSGVYVKQGRPKDRKRC